MARQGSEGVGLRDSPADQRDGRDGFYSPPLSPVAARGGGEGNVGPVAQRRMTYPAGKIYHLVPARLVFGGSLDCRGPSGPGSDLTGLAAPRRRMYWRLQSPCSLILA